MNNNKNTFSGSFIEFFSMLVFFSLLVFSMIGCGGENAGMPDMNVMINPDAGMMDVDADTEDMGMVEADADVIADAGNIDSDVEADAGVEEDAAVLPDSDVPPVDGGVDAGPVEDLYLVWIPERVVGASDVMKRDEAIRICDEHNGFFFESQMANRSDAPEFNTDELHPFPPARSCELITNTITSCEFYKSRAEMECGQETTNYCDYNPCGGLFETYEMRYGRCLNGDMVSMPHADMVTYATCVEECEEDLVWNDRYFFDSRAYSAFWNNPVAPYNTLVGGRFLTTSYDDTAFNVICVVPESSIPSMPEGISGEYPRILYTGAAQ